MPVAVYMTCMHAYMHAVPTQTYVIHVQLGLPPEHDLIKLLLLQSIERTRLRHQSVEGGNRVLLGTEARVRRLHLLRVLDQLFRRQACRRLRPCARTPVSCVVCMHVYLHTRRRAEVGHEHACSHGIVHACGDVSVHGHALVGCWCR